MTVTTSPAQTLLELRSRWRRVGREPAVLRVALLASYTIDPLVAYLGVGLHDAGLGAAPAVGQFNQIVQQCLDDDSEVGRLAPDVLVVSPRFEEVWTRAPLADEPDPDGYARDMLSLADVALDAADRWRACLVFVLPAVPETVPYGVGDHGSPFGTVAVATAVREALRRRLSGRPNVYVADCEAAVRAVGSRNAHHPALFRFARVPYTDDVFAELADQITRLLRLRYGPPRRGLVIDADSLLFVTAPDTGATPRPGADTLRPVLAELRRTGTRIALRCSHEQAEMWGAVRAALGDDWPDTVDDVVLDDRPPDEQLRDLAAGLGLADEQMVVLTTADPLARHLGPRALRLADSADLWPAQLAAGGLYDCLPMVPTDAGAPGWETDVDFAVARRQRSLSVEEYVAGLGVCVTWRDADRDAAPSVTEMAMRTKDFTLGVDHTEQSLEAALADESTEIMLASVRDRLGDYGVGAAVRLRYADDACIVDLLLVSCPVLGKGVEDEVLSRILKLAEGRQCKTVTFRYSDTGRNGMALAYLRKVAAADQSLGVAVHLEPLP